MCCIWPCICIWIRHIWFDQMWLKYDSNAFQKRWQIHLYDIVILNIYVSCNFVHSFCVFVECKISSLLYGIQSTPYLYSTKNLLAANGNIIFVWIKSCTFAFEFDSKHSHLHLNSFTHVHLNVPACIWAQTWLRFIIHYDIVLFVSEFRSFQK